MTYWVYGVCFCLMAAGNLLCGPGRPHRLPAWPEKGRLDPLLHRLNSWKKKKQQMMQRDRKEQELAEAIGFLRNLTAAGRGTGMSSDLVLQKLAENSGLMQPVYLRLLSLLRLNRKTEAAAYFEQETGSAAGRDFLRLILQWDETDPAHLMQTLISCQKSMKEIRMTAQKKKDEIVSDLIYIPVVTNILVIFLNFIYVAYFIEQKEMLQTLFL